MNLIHIHLINNNEKIFHQLYEIYQVSFPISEQKSKEELQELLDHPDYSVFGVYRGDEMTGFAIYFRPIENLFYLLEYMAIDPLNRSSGLGKHLFIESLNILMGWFGEKHVIIEIDTPSSSDTNSPERRRERFYRNVGCKQVMGFNYILGLKTLHTPPPMSLMIYAPDHSTITKDELRTHVQSIYQNVYGRSGNEPEIDHMFNGLNQTLELI